MPEFAEPLAPAQPVVPVPAPISAARDAANRGDFAAFEKAETSARQGKPLPDVVASPVASAPAVDPVDPVDPVIPASLDRPVSKRQQQINDYERSIAELKAENARLKSTPAPAAPRSELPPPVTETLIQRAKRIAAMPDAPKLEDFDSVAEHSAAMSFFTRAIETQEHDAAADADRQRVDREQFEVGQRARHESFLAKLDAATAADPQFAEKLSPEVKALKPISGLEPGDPSGPLNVLWERVYDSPVMDKLLVYFTEHPEELRRFEQVPASIANLPPGARARAHIPWIVQEFGKVEARCESTAAPASEPAAAIPSTITSAPPPAPTLTRVATTGDPKAAAIKRGDFATFHKLETQELLAKRSRV